MALLFIHRIELRRNPSRISCGKWKKEGPSLVKRDENLSSTRFILPPTRDDKGVRAFIPHNAPGEK